MEKCVTPNYIQFSNRNADVSPCPFKSSQTTVPSNDTRSNGFTSFLWLCTVCCSETALPQEDDKCVSHCKAAKLTDKQLAKLFRKNLVGCSNSVQIPIQQKRNAAFNPTMHIMYYVSAEVNRLCTLSNLPYEIMQRYSSIVTCSVIYVQQIKAASHSLKMMTIGWQL